MTCFSVHGHKSDVLATGIRLCETAKIYGVCVCVCVCVCACVRACVCVRACTCMHACSSIPLASRLGWVTWGRDRMRDAFYLLQNITSV